MPNISQRGKSMPASPIRKLVPYANAAKAKGVHVYHLNIGQPDIKTPQLMLDAVRNMDMEILSYAPSQGNASYRNKLVGYYAKQSINVSADEILITTGGSEAIYFTLLSCFDNGDEVIIPEPMYANYNGFAHAGSVNIVPVTTSISNGFALLSKAEFEKRITAKTKGIIICNPNNPTGYLYSKEELNQLREIALKHNLFLIADEVYREFVYDNAVHYSILQMPGMEEHAIVVDSISKRYSACGARIGALVSRNNEVIQTALKFGQARLSPPSLAQIAAEAAIEVPDSYMKAVKAEYVSRRNFIVDRLNKIEGVACPMPGGAFYCIAALPVESAEDFSQWLLTDFEHNNKTLMVAPAAGFYSTAGLGKNEVRIAYVLKNEDLAEAIELLELALKKYPKQIQ